MGAEQYHQGTLKNEIHKFIIKTSANQGNDNEYYSRPLLEKALQLSDMVVNTVGGFNSDLIQTLNLYICEAKQKLGIKG
ncbi:MAG TPA: hypothetical protein PLW93_03140 [Candidatus Absconditabacterales bacterium]|nr:hypothetical protein [Candidatus Absconditabacterales bacterium]HNG97246.1 hypothetical protein [Candidatus Absconditabacterales bacterium]